MDRSCVTSKMKTRDLGLTWDFYGMGVSRKKETHISVPFDHFVVQSLNVSVSIYRLDFVANAICPEYTLLNSNIQF